jgi:purine-binding chemotaxis protein CheW
MNTQSLYDLLPHDDIAHEIMKVRAHALATKPIEVEENINLNSCICVRLGSREVFGIPYHDAIEINRNQHITPIVHAPNFIAGITNWRGKVITAMNLAQLFGITSQDTTRESDVIIVSINSNIVALSISELIESKEYDSMNLKPSLPIKGGVKQEYVTGIIDGFISVLNMNKIFDDMLGEMNKWRVI